MNSRSPGRGVWSPYSPIITGASVGDGTVVARFTRIDGRVDFLFQLTLGASSAVTGPVGFTLPLASSTLHQDFRGSVAAGGSDDIYSVSGVVYSTNAVTVHAPPASPGGPLVATGPGVPVPWTPGTVLTVNGSYEAA